MLDCEITIVLAEGEGRGGGLDFWVEVSGFIEALVRDFRREDVDISEIFQQYMHLPTIHNLR